MPPRLPDRYRLSVRLGADGDVEEWLATDEHLERALAAFDRIGRELGLIGG